MKNALQRTTALFARLSRDPEFVWWASETYTNVCDRLVTAATDENVRNLQGQAQMLSSIMLSLKDAQAYERNHA